MAILRQPRAAGWCGRRRSRPRHMVSCHTSCVLAKFGDRRPNGGRARSQKEWNQAQNRTHLSEFFFRVGVYGNTSKTINP